MSRFNQGGLGQTSLPLEFHPLMPGAGADSVAVFERKCAERVGRDMNCKCAAVPVLLGGLWMGLTWIAGAAEPSPTMNPLPESAAPVSKTEKATLGGGCFWCLEAVFERVPGVRAVVSGYAGGRQPDPTYEQVCDGATGHAEVVQIEFDPAVVSYRQLLDIFWRAHDGTTPNRQGADVGTQYRSVILWQNEAQHEVAEASKREADQHSSRPMVTEIQPLDVFYPAEEYHQNYFARHPDGPYCAVVIAPKVEKLEKTGVVGKKNSPQ
jgi:peptide-methionine (S)-S-oxide reductase